MKPCLSRDELPVLFDIIFPLSVKEQRSSSPPLGSSTRTDTPRGEEEKSAPLPFGRGLERRLWGLLKAKRIQCQLDSFRSEGRTGHLFVDLIIALGVRVRLLISRTEKLWKTADVLKVLIL
jgi:hypothetical protein